MADVKNAHASTNRFVFRDQSAARWVLDRHIPAAKIDHFRAKSAVQCVQRRFAKLAHRRNCGGIHFPSFRQRPILARASQAVKEALAFALHRADALLTVSPHVRLAARALPQVKFSRGHPCKVLLFVCSATCRNPVAPARSTAPFAKGRPTSTFVPTASITVPIVVKPATSRWLRAVATDPKNLHMCMDADARLAAAAGGVARFLADAAGLESDSAGRLQSAVVEACLKAFEHLAGKHPHLEVTFARFSDRLEVSLAHEEAATAIAVEAVTSTAGKKTESEANSVALAGVDRVQHETHGKEAITRLTKYLRQVAPSL